MHMGCSITKGTHDTRRTRHAHPCTHRKHTETRDNSAPRYKGTSAIHARADRRVPRMLRVRGRPEPPLVSDSLRLSGQCLTHQAHDQPVALDRAHAVLELAQDLVLVLNVAALRLPIEEDQIRAPRGVLSHTKVKQPSAARTCCTSTDSPAWIDLISECFSLLSKSCCCSALIAMSSLAPLNCVW